MQVLFRAKEKNSNNYVIGYEYYNHKDDNLFLFLCLIIIVILISIS